jgi:glucose/arabinose dehydrogenase
VTGLDVPWSVLVLPDGNALVSLRDQAKITRIDRDAATHLVRAPGPGGSVPGVQPAGEGGLLGLAVLPDDATQLFV